MHDHEWKSGLSGLMKSFIEMNHLAGLKFEQQERFLRHFDHFCFYNGYEGQILTREMAESFIYGQGGADRTLHCKEVLLYRFAEFMAQRGCHAYLPDIRTKYPATTISPIFIRKMSAGGSWKQSIPILKRQTPSETRSIPSCSGSCAAQAAGFPKH